MTGPAIWLAAAALAWAIYRGTRAAIYVWGLYREERRRDHLQRRVGQAAPEPPTRRLLRWLALLTTGIALAGGYFALLLAYRMATGESSPEWVQPISAAVIIALLLAGDFIATRLRILEREGRLDTTE